MGEELPEIHPHVVWSGGNGPWAEYLLAVKRRIFVGLQEGFRKTADEGTGKVRIGRLRVQEAEEGKAGGFHGRKHTQPLLLLHLEKPQPAVQLGKGDGEAFAELLNCGKVQEILRQDTEDEEQAITGVGDDEVREDGMSMAAGTDEAEDAEAVSDGGAADEVNEGAVIVGMDPAGAFCPTAGTGLELWAESRHKRVKQGFG